MLFFAIKLLIPNIAFQYIAHIPDLIEHYQSHKKEIGENSFLAFMFEHLGDENHTHKDLAAHDNLPFHHQHATDYSQTLTFFAPFHFMDFRFKEFASSSVKIASKQHFYNSAYLKSIWQPPKLG